MKKILILEDNPKIIEIIVEALNELGSDFGKFDLMFFTKGGTAEKFLKDFDSEKFSLVLLDYISSDDENFHQAILGRINPDKIIAISNTDAYNELAMDEGVSRVIRKDYFDLAGFRYKIKKEIKNCLQKNEEN